MKKSFSQKRMQKKNRGVAVIFTLGILGLLTVMALGFASTALLNRKIADNTSSAEYARHIAKNIAFARAKNAVLRNAVSLSAYYSDGTSDWDFLHRMDTFLDGVEIYRVTDDSGNFKNNTARWQYVFGPEKDAKSDKYPILGRYAYAIVPDIGRMDPNIHLGTTDAANRYGFSVQELSLPNGSSGSTNWKESLSGKLEPPNRWRSFREMFISLSKDMTALSTDDKKIFSDGISLNNYSKPPETFWLDLNRDGKRTADEMYLRFNMTRNWNSTSVDDLIGTSDSYLTLENADGAKSLSFIPWLKNWDYLPSGTTGWTADLIKKQIAANIIQYNRGAEQPTVTDKANSADWLTDGPSYAGIGRHPMLNEIGFLIRVHTEVEYEEQIPPDEDHIKIKYKPIYYITVDAGAELIYPFGSASGLNKSQIKFSGTTSGSVTNMIMKFKLRKFLQDESPELTATVSSLGNNLIGSDGVLSSKMIHEHIDEMVIGSDGEVTKLITSSTTPEKTNDEGLGYKWTNFDLSLESEDWNGSPAYTKADKFWKEEKTEKQQRLKIPIRTFTMTTSKSVGTAEQICRAMEKRMTIEWENFTPGNVVLRIEQGPDNYIQRDVVLSLKEPALPSNNYGKDYDNNDIRGWAGMDKDTKKVWYVSYEATDPLVNHYQDDWKMTSTDLLSWTGSASNYPGSAGSLNSTISGKLPLSLKINDSTIQEKAADPAYTAGSRLSTSYIRHGQMKSLWELGFISRAEPFRTLNLAKTRTFTLGTAVDGRKPGSFEAGDANILDQVKLSESSASSDDQLERYGKINLNSNSHRVFAQVFNPDVKWFETLWTSATTESPFAAAGTASTAVCGDTACLTATPCSNPESCTHKYNPGESKPGCLAHLLIDRSTILPFTNRSDLLVEPTDAELAKLPGYDALSSDQRAKLKAAQGNLRDWLLRVRRPADPEDPPPPDPLNKAEKEQYAARFMNLFCAEPLQHVYIVVLAQSIKDIGGVPTLIDWNNDGEYSSSALTIPTDTDDNMKKFLRTGFVRKKLSPVSGENQYEKVGTTSSVSETISSTEVGTYEHGADKITGETKLIAEMIKDAKTGKWKVAGFRYVE